MPVPSLKIMAKESKKSLNDAERYWGEAKKSAKDAGFSEGSPNFYAYIMGIVKRRLGLSKNNKIKKCFDGFLDISKSINIEKAKDINKLRKEIIVDKTGKRTTTYIKPKIKEVGLNLLHISQEGRYSNFFPNSIHFQGTFGAIVNNTIKEIKSKYKNLKINVTIDKINKDHDKITVYSKDKNVGNFITTDKLIDKYNLNAKWVEDNIEKIINNYRNK